jgi:arginine/ornithine transport system substrate-binding protein
MRFMTLAMAALLAFAANTADAKEWKKVRIGVEGAYPPFSQVTPEGKLEGFDIDIAHALCEQMKVECELVQQDWDGIIPALNARKYDAIIASMSINEERKKSVDFTNKYYYTPAQFVQKKDAGQSVAPGSLDGKRVGVQRATIHDCYLSAVYPDAEIVRYGTQDEANLDMVSGRLDLLLADKVALRDGFLNTQDGKGYEFVGPELKGHPCLGEGAGIALRKGEDDLRQMFNEALDAIRANGKYNEIASKYFDFDVYGS